MTSRVDRDARDRGPGPVDDPRVVAVRYAAAHPPEHAVVARLERQVEVRQRPRRAIDPGAASSVVVDVLRLDRAEADPLDVGLVEDPADEPGERQRAPACASRAAPRSDQPPSYVPMLMPGEDDLAVAGGERAAHVREHGLRREAPLGAAGPRDDAVRAEERAAVLDLHERPGPLHRGAVVGDAVDGVAATSVDARQRRAAAPAERASHRGRRSSASSSARSAALSVVADEPRRGRSTAANASGPTWTEQPVTTISASGFARRARRTAARDFSSAVGRHGARVDEHEVRRPPGRRAGPPPRAAAARRPPSRTG